MGQNYRKLIPLPLSKRYSVGILPYMESLSANRPPAPLRQTPAYNSQPSTVASDPTTAASVGNPVDTVTTSTLGDRLAQSTLDAAATNRQLSKRRCYHFVKEGLAAEGVNLQGRSAYQAANQLARDDRFTEVRVQRNQLSELPAGSVVVWNKTKKHANGHISVSLGDGREVSDRIRTQTEAYQSSFRVFLPQGTQLPAQLNS